VSQVKDIDTISGTPGVFGGGGRVATDEDFDTFYRVRYGALAAQLYAYLGDTAEAEDVAQEAFLRAWQRWSTIRKLEDPVAWVRKVAWNLATSRWRHLVVVARAAVRLSTPSYVEPVQPDRVVVVAALQRVAEQYRRVLVLHYIADMSVADIATQLSLPRGTVLSWLHRGRQDLAFQLSGLAARMSDTPALHHAEGRAP
jgi:RNA polymerase sigma-70 factor, ECF subfamily